MRSNAVLAGTAYSVRPNHHLGHPTTTWEGCRLTSQGYSWVRARDSGNQTNLFCDNLTVHFVTVIQIGAQWRRRARAALQTRPVFECAV